MSISASIDIKLAFRDSQTISKVALIQSLLDFGWTFKDCGNMTYLPIGDEDKFDWKTENISVESLMVLLNEKEKRDEQIGVAMTWKDSGIGGDVLLMKNGEISVSLTINRRVIIDSDITDVNWYLVKLLPALNDNNLIVESFSYEEHI
ncbi:hypothetical protein [Pelosinus sp. IPA-1]|uniref:hypothetical protein n=1 Tax=Pelosinus sp. IPA-1 TaxID=3029569 RepID=UPI00243623F6|nr:hypothetical protein [Pelosinus sp. IPA-1]GMA97769.1 hypothetical protein PIPA1_05690 [Pelosinus sp. IPA-1]